MLVLKKFDYELHLLLVLAVDCILDFLRHLLHTVEAIHLWDSYGLDVRLFDILLRFIHEIIILAIGIQNVHACLDLLDGPVEWVFVLMDLSGL